MNVFAISYYAPPQLTPQAIQIGRQLYHLDARVTLLHGRDAQFSNGFDQYPDFFDRVHALGVANPGPWFKGRLHRAALRAVPLYGVCPDLLGPWRRLAHARAMAAFAQHRPDVMASFGMPMSCHLLGLELKRRTGLPWLAHFSDPWVDNPFHDTGWVAGQVNALLEKRVLAQADQLLFTSQRTLELVMQKYPRHWRSRAAVLPHAWDMAHFPTPLPVPDILGPCRVIRHIGACYGARSPQPLFAALAHIIDRSPQVLDGVSFEFVGHVSPHLLDSPALRALPPGLVRLRGQVGYRESLQLARSAAALLLIDAPSAGDSVFLPSKLVEYIGARKPVWGITPAGTSADLLAEWAGGRHVCAAPTDIEAVTRMLLAGLAALAEPGAQPGVHAVAERFAPERVSVALFHHLRRAATRCAGRPGAALGARA